MKHIYCLLIVLITINVYSQEKIVSLTIESTWDNLQKQETFKIKGQVSVSRGDTVRFDSVTYYSEFNCDMGAIGLDFEKLQEDCFLNMRPDCDPLLPFKKKQSIQVDSEKSYLFEYDVSSKFDKKWLNDGRLILSGTYRFRVTLKYQYRGKQLIEKTDWRYVTF